MKKPLPPDAPPSHRVERYVRKKNSFYRTWRKDKTWPQLDAWCTECLLVHGVLPHWDEYGEARRRRDWVHADTLRRAQARWRREIKTWCLKKGITTFLNRGASFYKYYCAWYRYQEDLKGIKCPPGRSVQMY